MKNIKHLLLLKLLWASILKVLPYLIIIAAWEFLIKWLKVPSYLVSAPSDIWQYSLSNYKIILLNASITSLEAIVGLVLAIVVAIGLGIISVYSVILLKFCYKTLLLVQIIPLMAIAPLMILWLGFGVSAKILIVFLVCLFPILVSFLRGCLSTSSEMLNLFKTFGTSSFAIFRWVIFPNGCNSLFSGIKIAVTYSITSAVVSEYLGAEKGIGVYLTRAISSFNTEALFTNIVVIIFLTLMLYGLVACVESIAMPWRTNIKKETL